MDGTKEARVKNRDRRDETCEISCRIYSMKYDYKMNEQIRKELNIRNLNDIVDYKRNWTQRLLRTRDTHIHKLVHMYILAGIIKVGQPRERWKPPHMKMEQAWMAYTLWLIIMITYRNSNEISSLIILLHLVSLRT